MCDDIYDSEEYNDPIIDIEVIIEGYRKDYDKNKISRKEMYKKLLDLHINYMDAYLFSVKNYSNSNRLYIETMYKNINNNRKNDKLKQNIEHHIKNIEIFYIQTKYIGETIDILMGIHNKNIIDYGKTYANIIREYIQIKNDIDNFDKLHTELFLKSKILKQM